MDIPAIYCSTWMARNTELSEAEKQALKDEMMYYDGLLCPDTDNLVVKGGTFGPSHFELRGMAK